MAKPQPAGGQLAQRPRHGSQPGAIQCCRRLSLPWRPRGSWGPGASRLALPRPRWTVRGPRGWHCPPPHGEAAARARLCPGPGGVGGMPSKGRGAPCRLGQQRALEAAADPSARAAVLAAAAGRSAAGMLRPPPAPAPPPPHGPSGSSLHSPPRPANSSPAAASP